MPHHLMLTVMKGLIVAPKLHKDVENKYLLQIRVKDSY